MAQIDDQTRYRVTGAIFLLALSIIVLPMVFDGDGAARMELPPMQGEVEMAAVPTMSEVAPESDFIERVDELRASVDADGFAEDTQTQFGEPALTTPNDDTSMWAVQIASFAIEGNALKFREELQRDGFKPLLSHTRSGEEVLTRVAIGPILAKADAQALMAQLSQRYETDTRLMQFDY
jgi:cell division septation protein DedD